MTVFKKEKIKKFKLGLLSEIKNSKKQFFISLNITSRMILFKLYEEIFVRKNFFKQYSPNLNFFNFFDIVSMTSSSAVANDSIIIDIVRIWIFVF
jgi:hypothetical protein